MEEIIAKKRVTAYIFIIFLFVFSIFNAVNELPILVENMENVNINETAPAELIAQVNSIIDENVVGKYYFIDTFGYIQRILDKNEESNFELVKDTEGKLHYTYFNEKINDTSELANRVKVLADTVENDKTKIIYVMPPDKFIEGHTKFSTGIPYNMANETANDFLARLDNYGIDNIDLRDYISNSGLEMSDIFYTTDHHWKVETAFWAASQFCDILNEKYNEKLDPDNYFKDKEHYNFITYDKIFLGSMGRKAGRFYTSVDDFTLVYPKFDTKYSYINSLSGDLEFIGRFEEALIATPVIRNSNKPYDTDLYGSYLYGNPGFAHIENLDNEDGIKICVIKDSFAVPFAAFVSLRCNTVDMIDPRDFEDSYVDTINEGDYDYVVIMFSPQNLADEFFRF